MTSKRFKTQSVRWYDNYSESGQAMIESLFIVIFITAAVYAAFQLCVLSVNDLIFNEAAFAAARTTIFAQNQKQAAEAADSAVSYLVEPHMNTKTKNLLFYETKVWTDEPLSRDILGHAGIPVMKYNTNIEYTSQIMFASLLKPFFFGSNIITRTARARMINSPDSKFYNKAYPNARNFEDFKEQE